MREIAVERGRGTERHERHERPGGRFALGRAVGHEPIHHLGRGRWSQKSALPARRTGGAQRGEEGIVVPDVAQHRERDAGNQS